MRHGGAAAPPTAGVEPLVSLLSSSLLAERRSGRAAAFDGGRGWKTSSLHPPSLPIRRCAQVPSARRMPARAQPAAAPKVLAAAAGGAPLAAAPAPAAAVLSVGIGGG